MLNDIINEIKNKFNTTVPIDNVIQYVITAFNFGKLENSESFKFRRFNNECNAYHLTSKKIILTQRTRLWQLRINIFIGD